MNFLLLIMQLCTLVQGVKQTHGLVQIGNSQPTCKPFRTFKSKFIQECTSYATPKLIHITTPGFSDFYKKNLWVKWKINTKSVLQPIRLIIENIDIDCEAGYLQISEGDDKFW